jgi:hypothetical protein
VCPGYHDPKTVVFRDQTEAVIQKTRKPQPKLPIPPFVDDSVELQAKQVFLSQYVFGSIPLLEYLPTFYPRGVSDQHFAESIRALYMVVFSREVFSHSVLQTARRSYGQALSLTNKALQSTQLAMKDTMLLTVLLLDLFENLAPKDEPSSLESEKKHIDGAIAVVKLRGSNQFSEPVSLKMFHLLSRNVLMRCLQRGIAVPQDFISLRTSAAEFVDKEDPKWRFSDLMIQYALLRSVIRSSQCSETQILSTAMQMDEELFKMCSTMPPAWYFSRRNRPNPSKACTELHDYPNLTVQKLWNNMRSVRILLNENILNYYPRVWGAAMDENTQPQLPLSTIQLLISDICACVPVFDKKTKDQWTPASRACAHILIFPLYVAASSPSCPFESRLWIIEQLDAMGSSFHILQALMVKDMLSREQWGNPWRVASMLGSLSS